MAFNDFERVTLDAVFDVVVGGAGPQAIGSVTLVDGGDNYMVGDVLPAIAGVSAGTGLVITVTGVEPTGFSPSTTGVGAISEFTFTDDANWVAADDGQYTVVGATLVGVGSDFVPHTEYELGGDIDEYIEGSGLLVDISTDAGGSVLTAVLGTSDASKGYIVGTQVRVIEGTNDTALLSIDSVDADGVVLTLGIIDAGSGYTASQASIDDLVASQAELKTDSPEVYWQGTMTGVFNPATAPDKTVDDNDPRITVTRKADEPQLVVQKRYIDNGTVEVYAEPTLVDRDGNVVGNTVRAEDCVDRPRCEANGFVWVAESTGDAGQADYGYCRELLSSEVTNAMSDEDCPAGSYWDGGTGCTDYVNTEAAVINGKIATLGLERSMRDCEVGGMHWDITADACVDGDVAAAYSVSGTVATTAPTPGRTGSAMSSRNDYLANACQQLGYVWNYNDATCNAVVDPATLTDQVACKGAGYLWIAGTCYNPNDFGDGQSRNATTQEDPNVAPK